MFDALSYSNVTPCLAKKQKTETENISWFEHKNAQTRARLQKQKYDLFKLVKQGPLCFLWLKNQFKPFHSCKIFAILILDSHLKA